MKKLNVYVLVFIYLYVFLASFRSFFIHSMFGPSFHSVELTMMPGLTISVIAASSRTHQTCMKWQTIVGARCVRWPKMFNTFSPVIRMHCFRTEFKGICSTHNYEMHCFVTSKTLTARRFDSTEILSKAPWVHSICQDLTNKFGFAISSNEYSMKYKYLNRDSRIE